MVYKLYSFFSVCITELSAFRFCFSDHGISSKEKCSIALHPNKDTNCSIDGQLLPPLENFMKWLCHFWKVTWGICYKVFYGQVVRFQRLCTKREDFELRTRFLLGVFKDWGYSVSLLGRQFGRAVAKYIAGFQRWELPVDIRNWFRIISG